jgi:hypothetical protein
MASDCARRSAPGFSFFRALFAKHDADRVPKDLRKGVASTEVGASDGIRAKRSLTTVRLANSRRELWADYGLPGGVRVWIITSSARVC